MKYKYTQVCSKYIFFTEIKIVYFYFEFYVLIWDIIHKFIN